MLRDIAQGIADFISEDEILHRDGDVTVVVEDKSDIGTEIANALGQLGVCVLVAITGFRRVDGLAIPQGAIQFQISCFENPILNREDLSTLTAQGVMERIVTILHYKKFPFILGQVIFQDFARDDVDEANIVRGNFEAHTTLNFSEEYFCELRKHNINN
jgi:hypothetical protein